MPLGTLDPLAALAALEAPAPASTPANQAAPATGPSWLSTKYSQVVVVVLGLLLIAAGLFSFDKTREVIVSGAKTAAKAAA